MVQGKALRVLLALLLLIVLNVSRALATTATMTPDKAAPQLLGARVRFTTAAAAGVAPYSFKWWLWDGTRWSILRDWSNTAAYDWSPTVGNRAYRVRVWVRSASRSADVEEASAVLDYPIIPKTSDVTLTTSVPAPQPAGTAITWIAHPSLGLGPHSYKWWLWNGSTWSVLREWSTNALYMWTPTTAGNAYQIRVWVRSAGVTADAAEASKTSTFSISAPPSPPAVPRVSSVTLTPDKTAPQLSGTAITWTARATGGPAPQSYKWWLWDGSAWRMLRDWGTTATFAWTPTSPNGSYQVRVWAKSAGNAADAEEASQALPYAITQSASRVTSVSLSADKSPTEPVGSNIRFTAAATGGTPPVSFKWLVEDGGTSTVLANWSTNTTFVWTPTQPSQTVRVVVWARNAASTTDTPEASYSLLFPIRPADTECVSSIDPQVMSFGSGGGSGSAGVVASQSTCTWDVVSQATWVTVSGSKTRTGNGTVTFAVAPNTDTVSRTGAVRIGTRSLSIVQGGSSTSEGCTYAVFPTALDVSSDNETTEVAVTAPTGCPWSASTQGFATVSPSTGSGSGTVTIFVENNTSQDPRATVLSIAGRAVTLMQAGLASQPQGCSYSVTPSEATFDFHAGTGSVLVSTSSGCSWQATPQSAFIHVTSGTTGSGSGTVTYTVEANGGDGSRSGLLIVAGRTVTVSQGAAVLTPPCVFTLSSSSATVSYGGASGAVSVSTSPGCEWTVASHTDWIHVTDQSGPGDGNVWYSVDPNSGGERSGTLVIAGQTFTISQGEPPTTADPDEITWHTQPDSERVGDCAGNCGAGCGTFFNPCGGPHYWEHTVLSAPQYAGDDWEPVCSGDSSWFVVRPRYTALARWTYHGLKSALCEEHDETCRNLNLIPYLFADKILCLATAGLVGLNGLNYCDGAQPFDWSYEFIDVGHGPIVAYIDGAPSCN